MIRFSRSVCFRILEKNSLLHGMISILINLVRSLLATLRYLSQVETTTTFLAQRSTNPSQVNSFSLLGSFHLVDSCFLISTCSRGKEEASRKTLVDLRLVNYITSTNTSNYEEAVDKLLKIELQEVKTSVFFHFVASSC